MTSNARKNLTAKERRERKSSEHYKDDGHEKHEKVQKLQGLKTKTVPFDFAQDRPAPACIADREALRAGAGAPSAFATLRRDEPPEGIFVFFVAKTPFLFASLRLCV
ncbi:MAG: hypothetical protein ISR85_02685 [Kiritimatiellales bacterium]|nr:hypothetical protein [Kiritimatiellota bacterium]MBL7011819.1 hypothetical protein [Kiritimatiellales bacterium]